MSEISNHKEARINAYRAVIKSIINKENAKAQIELHKEVLDKIQPTDVIDLVDLLVKEQLSTAKIKDGINRFLTLVSKTIADCPRMEPKADTLLDVFIQNNRVMDSTLKQLKTLIISFNKDAENPDTKQELLDKFTQLEDFTIYYTIKENVLFPVLEKEWSNFRCLQIMWSFHDDVRRNTKEMLQLLSTTKPDLARFNRLCGDIFFNMSALKLREEYLLFPFILQTIENKTLDALIPECQEIGFPFVQAKIKNMKKTKQNENVLDGKIDLQTGGLTIEQIRLIFNHLPVDITYVDEYDKVCYFSTPKKRIFPRTNSIIGREVKNCHPPESVHVVEQIVDAFKTGKKDIASFWIKMRGEFIYIQYFAVRDDNGNYKGVIEVTQEISEINNLTGERRLLDWEN